MKKNNVVLMLVYEPSSTEAAPIPVVRLSDGPLAVAVAEAAVHQAEMHAKEVSRLDEVLGRIEELEAYRLRELLALLVPGFPKPSCVANPVVM
jgi:hypothetical protein